MEASIYMPVFVVFPFLERLVFEHCTDLLLEEFIWMLLIIPYKN
jgi:hypothetical protein